MTSIFALQFPIVNHPFLVYALPLLSDCDPYLCKLSVVLYLSWFKWIIRKQIGAWYCLSMNWGLMPGWNGPWCGRDIVRPAVCVNVWVLHAEVMFRVVWLNYSEPVILSTTRTHAIFLFVCFSALWSQQWPIYRDVYCSPCWPFPWFCLYFHSIFFQCVLVCYILMCLSTSCFFVTWFQDVSLYSCLSFLCSYCF